MPSGAWPPHPEHRTLPAGNPSKLIKGVDFDTEFDAIATAVATKANTASPTLTGTPPAPTAALSTNTTQVATTAFVQQEITDKAAAKASPTFTGNLTLSSSAARLRGDLSNATVANRVLFQSSTTNGATTVGAIPNGTSNVAEFTAYNNSGASNAAYMAMGVSNTIAYLSVSRIGAGGWLPLVIDVASSERARFGANGGMTISQPNSGVTTLALTSASAAAISISATGGYDAISISDGTVGMFWQPLGAGGAVFGTSTNHPVNFRTNNARVRDGLPGR